MHPTTDIRSQPDNLDQDSPKQQDTADALDAQKAKFCLSAALRQLARRRAEKVAASEAEDLAEIDRSRAMGRSAATSEAFDVARTRLIRTLLKEGRRLTIDTHAWYSSIAPLKVVRRSPQTFILIPNPDKDLPTDADDLALSLLVVVLDDEPEGGVA